MDIQPLNAQVIEQVLDEYGTWAAVTLRSAKVKQTGYDPYRDTGYKVTQINPIFVRVLTRAISANTLVYQQFGLTESGAIELIMKDSDLEIVKLAERLKVNDQEYYVYHDAVGNRLQTRKLALGFSKVTVFLKDT